MAQVIVTRVRYDDLTIHFIIKKIPIGKREYITPIKVMIINSLIEKVNPNPSSKNAAIKEAAILIRIVFQTNLSICSSEILIAAFMVIWVEEFSINKATKQDE